MSYLHLDIGSKKGKFPYLLTFPLKYNFPTPHLLPPGRQKIAFVQGSSCSDHLEKRQHKDPNWSCHSFL